MTTRTLGLVKCCNWRLSNVITRTIWSRSRFRTFSSLTSGDTTMGGGCDTEEKRRKPFVVGVGGPSGSGKTQLTGRLQAMLEKRFREGQQPGCGKELRVVRTTLDVFYRPLTPAEFKLHEQGKVNFDIPGALDDSLMEKTLRGLISQKDDVLISGYDYSTCLRTAEGTVVYSPPFDFIILEGTLALGFKSLRNLFDLRIYVDADLDVCLARRIIRDQAERGRTIEHILKQWLNTVKPASVEYCLPTKKHGDIVLKGDVHDEESLSLLANYMFERKFSPSQDTIQLWPFKQ